jgi:hypothetical protein
MNETEDDGKMLVVLLARERALFRPFRQADWQSGSTAARYELQSEFRRKGLRWTVGGSVNERKAAETQIAALRKAGLLVNTGRTKGRHLLLTDRGRRVAEVLADVPSRADAHRAVVALLQFAPAGVLVSELLPAALKNYGTGDYQSKLYDVQIRLLPALVCGWAEVFSDIHGRAAYRVTPTGETAAEQPEPTSGDGPPPDPALCELYDAEYEHERQRLLNAKPSRENEIGPIPLSAGAWGDVVGPWTRRRRTRKAKT